ncbi:MAG: prepilin-type N-terminal cleavage/methylation domain-containing protein [Planctomycetota bacterium]|nr:prepilin-type N-terminal cleavage/methylation domain-containing protein [Planctomycetota bacterium]
MIRNRATTVQSASTEQGFTLLEAMVALAIIAMVITSYLGIRTAAVGDGLEARNWRLAREIAEERMSELLAGAHELPPESGERIPLENYDDFYYQILIGEASITDAEAAIADQEAMASGEQDERSEWQSNRETFRKASARGMSQLEYEDAIREEEYQREMENRAPSESEFEEVAVIVYFPKVLEEYEGQEETFIIKSRASTLSIAGYTPEQARQVAESQGQIGTDNAMQALQPGSDR